MYFISKTSQKLNISLGSCLTQYIFLSQFLLTYTNGTPSLKFICASFYRYQITVQFLMPTFLQSNYGSTQAMAIQYFVHASSTKNFVHGVSFSPKNINEKSHS